MIERVYSQVVGQVDDAYVATDDDRIRQAVEAFGGKVVMTSPNHKSGTDRCREAADSVGGHYDVVINIQGDEPTLVKPFTPADGWEALHNPNSPKVVVNQRMEALYFSRSVIPYCRGKEQEQWLSNHTYYKHIGLYAYTLPTLQAITRLPQSSLELAESLEQLRWLENGYTIRVGVTQVETIGIDTPEDLQRAELFLHQLQSERL